MPADLKAVYEATEKYSENPERANQLIKEAVKKLPATLQHEVEQAVAMIELQGYYGKPDEAQALKTALVLGMIDPSRKLTKTSSIAADIAKDVAKVLDKDKIKAEIAAVVTAEGKANSATAQRLREQLLTQNLTNIAAQDVRLAVAVDKGVAMGTGSHGTRLSNL